jgi:putative nucleotidyltransferase with HDIG domain
MNTRPSMIRQPLVGLVTSAVAVALLATAWMVATPQLSTQQWLQTSAVALAVMAAQYLAYLFPVHVRYSLKLEMGSVPLYLAAVLLPIPVAGATVAIALTFTETMARKTRGSTLGDIATQSGRWTVIVLVGSAVTHLVPAGLTPSYLLILPVVAAVLLCGDLLTIPFELSAINGESVLYLLVDCVRGVGLAEACQYFFGMMGAVLALSNVWNAALLLVPIVLIHRLAKRSKELHESTRVLLESLADQVDSKDPYTHEHSKRVTRWTRELLRELQVVGPEAELIITCARLHDIGKISLPENILHKHEQLTPEDWEIMERHPAIGADMVSRYPAFARGAHIIRHHHERMDGAGYPDKIAGSAIPFGARVLAVADSFDAMITDRPYRAGMPVERAAAILKGGSGSQWDAAIVDAFMRVIADQLQSAVTEAGSLAPLARSV